jgi:hypothetical protein
MNAEFRSMSFAKHIPRPLRNYLDNQMRNPEILQEVKSTLAALVEKSPGRAIEVRIPPYAAVQCGAGPKHTRGTPANVIEMDATTWLSLARGERTWADALSAGLINASGVRADLTEFLPIENIKSEERP